MQLPQPARGRAVAARLAAQRVRRAQQQRHARAAGALALLVLGALAAAPVPRLDDALGRLLVAAHVARRAVRRRERGEVELALYGSGLVRAEKIWSPDNASHFAPGDLALADEPIELNAGRERVELEVTNMGDRPVQVGSHFPFFEVNAELRFERRRAYGFRLDIPSGTAVRFEPGQALEVNLVEVGGRRCVTGFNSLTEGSIDSDDIKLAALTRAREQGFKGA